MRNVLIGVIIYLSCPAGAMGSFPSLTPLLYRPLSEMSDIFFEARAPYINDLIKKKLLIKNKPIDHINIYKLGNTFETEIVGSVKLSKTLDSTIKNLMLEKAPIIWGEQIEDLLEELKFVERKDNWYIYFDPTGLQDFEQLKIQFEKKTLTLKVIGTDSETQLKYFYERAEWSEGKLVLMKLESKTARTDQVIITKTNFRYGKIKDRIWLPVEMNLAATQQLVAVGAPKRTRRLVETIHFSHFKLEQGIAEHWFKSQKYSLKK